MSMDQVKIKVVEDILKINDEEILIEIENLIVSIMSESGSQSRLTELELNIRAEQSENDFQSGRKISGQELLGKFK